MTFSDITLKDLDGSATGPSGDSGLLRVVIRLSAKAPTVWAELFRDGWEQHAYLSKRKAVVSGDRIEVVCALEEMQSKHIPELTWLIAQTNNAYKRRLVEVSATRPNGKDSGVHAQQSPGADRRLRFD